MPFDFADVEWVLSGVFLGAAESGALARVMLSDAFAEYPALVLAVGFAVSVPLVAVAGLLLPRGRRGGADAVSRKRGFPEGASFGRGGPRPDGCTSGGEHAGGQGSVLRLGAVTADLTSGAVRLGSDSTCHFRLEGPGIEALHALITRDPAHGLQLVRLASTEGAAISVDGKIMSVCALSGSETIKIGHNIFVFDAHAWDSERAAARPVAAAANPAISAVAAVRRAGGARSVFSEGGTWQAEETAVASDRADRSLAH